MYPPKNKRFAVLAGNYKQFRSFLDSLGVKENEYVYASSVNKVKGITFDGYNMVGSFWERQDAVEIMFHLVIINPKKINDSANSN